MSNHNIPSDAKKGSGDCANRRNKVIRMTTQQIGCLSITLRNTSDFEDHEIWTALKEATSHMSFEYHSRVDVTVTNHYRDRFRGKCYGNGCSMHSPDPWRPLIIARITPEEKQFPQWIDCSPQLRERVVLMHGNQVIETKKVSSGGYISCWLLDRTECIIYVLSHEFRHLWQMERERGRVWGARGTFGDRDADAFAIRKVRKNRKLIHRQASEKALSSASALFSLPVAMNKEPSPSIDEDIKNQPIDFAIEDHLISLLHLENRSSLQSFVKDWSYDYKTLERFLYCDIIPEVPVCRNSATQNETKEDDYSSC